MTIDIRIMTAPADCWACGAETELVTRIHIRRPAGAAECAVSDLTEYPGLAGEIGREVEARPSVGLIKWRHSKTVGRQYMSNGCAHCDALLGDFFEVQARNLESEFRTFEPEDARGWDRLAVALLASPDGHLFHY